MTSLEDRLDALRDEVIELREWKATALQFIPRPDQIAGYGDGDAPEDVQELIELAKWLRSNA